MSNDTPTDTITRAVLDGIGVVDVVKKIRVPKKVNLLKPYLPPKSLHLDFKPVDVYSGPFSTLAIEKIYGSIRFEVDYPALFRFLSSRNLLRRPMAIYHVGCNPHLDWMIYKYGGMESILQRRHMRRKGV